MKIGLGGSCHWCTEAIFQSLIGVNKVEQGWISSEEFPAPSEAIVVYFDPSIISLEALIEIHLHTHSATSAHPMRGKYRSAIYNYNKEQLSQAKNALVFFQKDFDQPLITDALTFDSFKINKQEYLDYYYKNPEKAFCKNQINPKLRKLISEFRDKVDKEKLKLN